MKPVSLFLVAIASALLFYLLFYDAWFGLNLSLFALTMAAVTWWVRRRDQKGVLFRLLTVLVLLLAMANTWHGEGWTRFVLCAMLFMLAGSAALSEAQSPYLAFAQSAASVFRAQLVFFRNAAGTGGIRLPGLRKSGLYALPVLVIFLFTALYSAGNPVFGEWIEKALDRLASFFNLFRLDGILTFMIGLFISNLFVSSVTVPELRQAWLVTPRLLLRQKMAGQGRVNALNRLLLHEYRAGVFLLVALNIMLLVLNITDLRVVWFGFRWDGQLLRGFVHEGTWMLIISVIVAGITTLYLFRRNLNFLKHNTLLKWLVAGWLLQNAFLLLSVCMRNIHYINYYGLAYKRIGVMFFLLAVAGSLLFIWLKIAGKHSMQRFASRSLTLCLAVLSISALPDWSSIIARYNLKNFDRSFVHMEFLSGLPEHVLPVLQEYRYKLGDIREAQESRGYDYSDTVKGQPFEKLLDRRIGEFREHESGKDWRGFVWARRKALKRLGH